MAVMMTAVSSSPVFVARMIRRSHEPLYFLMSESRRLSGLRSQDAGSFAQRSTRHLRAEASPQATVACAGVPAPTQR